MPERIVNFLSHNQCPYTSVYDTTEDKKPTGVVKEKYPKAIKTASKTVTPNKAVTLPVREKKVAFDKDKQTHCINNIAKHYGIVMSLKPCPTKCRYTHYNKFLKTTTKAEMLPAVQELITKLGLTDNQAKQFEKKIKADVNFN